MNLEQIYKIEDNYLKYAESVILRLQYLFPKNNFFLKEKDITFSTNANDELSDLIKEISYLFYREKIYEDNLDIRKKLYKDF